MAQFYQTVTLMLSDGRKCVYSGPAQILAASEAKVVAVEITPPRPLPSGCSFEEMLVVAAQEKAHG